MLVISNPPTSTPTAATTLTISCFSSEITTNKADRREGTGNRTEFTLTTKTQKQAQRFSVTFLCLSFASFASLSFVDQFCIRPLAEVGYRNVPDSKTAVLRTKFPCSIECEARHGGTRPAREINCCCTQARGLLFYSLCSKTGR